MYLPFFVLGWKYEKETELIPKGKIATTLKIIILGVILYVFNMTVCMCVCAHAHAEAPLWKLEDSFVE